MDAVESERAGAGKAGGAPFGLFEREVELGRIDAFLADVCGARGRRLLIEGPPGIGKSVLLEAACAAGDVAGMATLRGEGQQWAQQVAFGCVGQLWRHSRGTKPGLELDGLDLSRRPGAPGADTQGRGHLHGLHADEAGPVAQSEEAVLRQWVSAVLELSEQTPVLVSVDDVQWVDGASLRFLALLAEHLSLSRVGLAVVLRSGEAPTGTPRGLLDERGAIMLRPAPLSAAGTARLLAARIGPQPGGHWVAACHQATAGNPFQLQVLAEALHQSGLSAEAEVAEVADAVRQIGSRALARTVSHRLECLDPQTRAFVEAAAVVGPFAGPTELGALTGLDAGTAAQTARRLFEMDLLRSPVGTELSHPLVAEAIRASIGSASVEALRLGAARYLCSSGRVEEAAGHLVALPRRGSAFVVETLAAAAQVSVTRGAPQVAAGLIRRALEEPPSSEMVLGLRAELGKVLVALGDKEAIPLLERVVDASEPVPGARLASILARAMIYESRMEDSVEVLDRAVERLGGQDPALAEELEAQALQQSSFAARLRATRLERLAAWGQRRGSSELAYRMRLAEAATESLASGQPSGHTADLAQRALAGGALLSGSISSHSTAATTLGYAGHPRAAREHITDAIAHIRASGELTLLAAHIGFLGEIDRQEGDVIATEATLRTARELAPSAGFATLFVLRGIVESLIEQEQIEAARQELRQAAMTGVLPELITSVSLLYARGRAWVAARQPLKALEDLRAAGRLADRFGFEEPSSIPWRIDAAEILLSLGDHAPARALAAEQLELARRLDAAHAIGPALRLWGLVTGGDQGCGALVEAVALLEGSYARLELGRALVDLGIALGGVGERDRARSVLDRGATLAEELGSVALARRASAALIATGARPRRAHRRGERALTPTERRVARLGAEQLSNREIAEALVVSRKTVESHMAAAFRKLGIKSRSELARALGHGQGPASDGNRPTA